MNSLAVLALFACVLVALGQYSSSGYQYGTGTSGQYYGTGSNGMMNGMYTDPSTGRQYTQQQVSSALQMCGSSSSMYSNNQMYSGSNYPYTSTSSSSWGRK